MPTITTTVTSAQATGAVTTVTTTEATPESVAAACAPQLGNIAKGNVMQRQYQTFTTQAAMAEWVERYELVLGMSRLRGGTSYCYVAQKGPLEIVYSAVYTSEADFMWIESTFAKDETIQRLMGEGTSPTAEAIIVGAITPAMQARCDAWDAAPGWSVKAYTNPEFMFCDGTPMTNDSLAAVSDFEFNTPEECDAFLAVGATFYQCIAIRCTELLVVKVNPTTIKYSWTFKTAADFVDFVTSDHQMAAMAPIIQMIPTAKTFGGVCFGNTVDPAVLSALSGWPTWNYGPLLCGSLGGQTYQHLQKITYKSMAARDTAYAALKASTMGGPGHGGAYFGIKVGESSIWCIHYAKNEADNKATQAGYGGDPALMAATKDIIACPTFQGGNKQKTWMTDLQGWSEAIPSLIMQTFPQVFASSSGEYGPDALVFLAEMEFKDADGWDKYADIMADPETFNSSPKMWVQGWRTSSTTGTYATTFSNVQDWVEHNKVFAKHAEAMGSLYESMTCYATGNITPEAKALCDFWNQAPWCNVIFAELAGKI